MHERIDNAYTILSRSAQLNQVTFRIDEENCVGGQFEAILSMGEVEIARGRASNKKAARQVCCETALQVMKENCTVFNERVKAEADGAVDLEQIKNGGVAAPKADVKNDKGAMLMRLMGWGGGGLGKNETGSTDVVGVNNFRCILSLDSLHYYYTNIILTL